MAAGKYRCISGDSHLEVDAKHWIHRVPERYRERAPRIIKTATGGDAWVIEGSTAREVPSDLYGGKGRNNWAPFGQTYEGTPGTGSPQQRVQEQDRDGIDAEVLYPCQVGGPWLWRNIPDNDAYLAIVRGYNDWLAEEYCSVAPDRLIGLGIIPMSNVADAVTEAGALRVGFAWPLCRARLRRTWSRLILGTTKARSWRPGSCWGAPSSLPTNVRRTHGS